MSNSPLDSPPDFLSNVQKSVIKALDPAEVLRAALSAPSDDPAANGPVIALHEIQSYLGAAKHQQRRIERIGASTHEAMREGRRRRGENLFAVVHFYLICWARIGKLAYFIRDTLNRNASKWNVPKFPRIGLILRQYQPELNDRIDARDHLEHFEERLRGQWAKKNPTPAAPTDLLNMTNEFLTFGGRKVDVGPNSLHLLKEIVAQFQLAVLYGSLEALEAADQRHLSRMLQRAAQDVAAKKLKRMLGGSV
jgi:hypothetical protein